MTPTVELVMDLSAQRHMIGLATPKDRLELTPEDATELISDLSTAVNLALTKVITATTTTKPKTQHNGRGRKGKAKVAPIPKLKWHRPEGPGYYVTELPQGAKAEVEGSLKEGWTVVINGQRVNNAPVAKKEMAYALVEESLRHPQSV